MGAVLKPRIGRDLQSLEGFIEKNQTLFALVHRGTDAIFFAVDFTESLARNCESSA